MSNIYYVDYENVSSAGLKGIENLCETDEVYILYSKKADNVKIDMLEMLMASKAGIHFLPVNVGTPNALDFQLVTLLFLNYKTEHQYYIISKDCGYDCCIKTAAQNGAPNVSRFPNFEIAARKNQGQNAAQGSSDSKAADTDRTPDNSNQVNDAKTIVPESHSNNTKPDDTAKKPDNTDPTDTAGKLNSPSPVNDDASGNKETVKKRTRRGGRGRKNNSDTSAETVSAAAENDSGKQDSVPKEDVSKEVVSTEKTSKENTSKEPVSILSIIRRRGDVQLDMHQIEFIRNALKTSANKQQFYKYFVKQMGQKDGLAFYNTIKSSYTDLINANLI